MSHFPAGQPSTLIPPSLLSTAAISDYAARAANRFMAHYIANVNMKVSGDTLLFTTEANRGYFIPFHINVICVDSYAAAAASAPNISVGFEAGNAYRNFVNQYGLDGVAGIFTGQWEKGYPVGGFYDMLGLEPENSQYARACPPSTGVYARVGATSSATVDLRAVSILGIYTG